MPYSREEKLISLWHLDQLIAESDLEVSHIRLQNDQYNKNRLLVRVPAHDMKCPVCGSSLYRDPISMQDHADGRVYGWVPICLDCGHIDFDRIQKGNNDIGGGRVE